MIVTLYENEIKTIDSKIERTKRTKKEKSRISEQKQNKHTRNCKEIDINTTEKKTKNFFGGNKYIYLRRRKITTEFHAKYII